MSKRFNFTKKSIDALSLPEKGKRGYYYDTKTDGLELMVMPSGAKSFKVYKKLHGKPIRVTLGKYPTMTIHNARAKAMEVCYQLSQGINPNEQKRQIRQEITFGELSARYVEEHTKHHHKSWQDTERTRQVHLSHLDNQRLSQITGNKVNSLHKKIGADSGHVIANRALAIISAMFNKAIEWGWEGTNPTKHVKKYKEQSRERFIRPHELPHFFAALQEEQNITARDYVLLSLYTGARKSNVLSMKWTDIDMERGEWRIVETKNSEPMTVPLSTEAIEILNRRRQLTNTKWVFPSDRTDSHLQDPKKAWKRIILNATIKMWEGSQELKAIVQDAREARGSDLSLNSLHNTITQLAERDGLELPTGLLDVRIHDLRRTLGSFQAAAGANQYIIGKSLGHKSTEATAVYARLDLDPVRQSVQTATEAIRMAGEKNG